MAGAFTEPPYICSSKEMYHALTTPCGALGARCLSDPRETSHKGAMESYGAAGLSAKSLESLHYASPAPSQAALLLDLRTRGRLALRRRRLGILWCRRFMGALRGHLCARALRFWRWFRCLLVVLN